MGHCPCLHCFVTKDEIVALGTKADMHWHGNHCTNNHDFQIMHTCKLIFEKGYAVAGKAIDAVLGDGCLVPTIICSFFFLFSIFTLLISYLLFQNVFSLNLGGFGFNHHQMFVADQLHEFELSVWKATFTHLLHILYAAGGNLIQELNHRCVVSQFYTKLT